MASEQTTSSLCKERENSIINLEDAYDHLTLCFLQLAKAHSSRVLLEDMAKVGYTRVLYDKGES